MGYIYKITNMINDKLYIGQTTRTIQARWKDHIRHVNNGNQSVYELYRAMKTDGISNFIISQIEECDNILLNERETFWITFYNSTCFGYNISNKGNNNIKFDHEKIKTLIKEKHNIEDIQKQINCSLKLIINLQKEIEEEKQQELEDQAYESFLNSKK